MTDTTSDTTPHSIPSAEEQLDAFLLGLAHDLLEQAHQEHRDNGIAHPRVIGLLPPESLDPQVLAQLHPEDMPLCAIADLAIPPAFFGPDHPMRFQALASARSMLADMGAMGTLVVAEAWGLRGDDAAEADQEQVRPMDHPKRRSILRVSLEVEGFHLTLIKDIESGEIDEQRLDHPWDDLEDKIASIGFCLPLGQLVNLSGQTNALYNRAIYAWFKSSGKAFSERLLHGCLSQIAAHGGIPQFVGSVVGACADAEGVDRAWLREASWRLLEPRVTYADQMLQEHGREPLWKGKMELIWEGALEHLPLEETLRRNPGLAEAMGYADPESVQSHIEQELERNPGGFYG